MNPQEAVEAARFDTQHYVSSFDDHEFLPGSLNVESRVSLKTIQELSSKGHKVKVQSEWGTLSAPTVIVFDTKMVSLRLAQTRGEVATPSRGRNIKLSKESPK